METHTKFLLDSGDPEEYKEIAKLAKSKGSELWGSTTNPSLIAKKLAGKKITQQKAFELQKEIVLEIINIVPGAVSAEVYADANTKADEMIKQGQEIATWHQRVVVKLPTNKEGFKARTTLRKSGIVTNNTLVFSQEQIFAICLHEQIIQSHRHPEHIRCHAELVSASQCKLDSGSIQIDSGSEAGMTQKKWPPFISPFVGRLDDIGINGMDLVKNGMKMKQEHGFNLWMLEASIRNNAHMQEGFDLNCELITAPAKVYQEWFINPHSEQGSTNLEPIPYWESSEDLLAISTIEEFMNAIESGKLNIQHDLTDKGIVKFAQDWKEIITS